MHPTPLLLAAALALTACATPPLPGQRVLRRATTMNTGVQVASYARWNENCQAAALPEARIITPPPHGTLVARPALVTAGNRLFTGTTNCRDKQIQGIELWYQPREGFRGTDPMAAEVTDGTTTTPVSATVDVR